MQYAILSDIHANLTALKTVWNALDAEGLTGHTVLNAGDTVGYGPDPEACVGFLREHSSCVSVKGNYDKNVALFPECEAEYRRKWAKSRPDKFATLQNSSQAISSDTRQWLTDLAAEAHLALETVPVVVTHYAPGSKEGLGVWTPDSRLAELAANTDAKVVVCGHTHTPFVRRIGGVLWINPGSLGLSRNDGHYHYAVLTLKPGLPPAAELRYAE